MRPGDPSVVSASDLADYVYCPRSHYYRHHPPAEGPSADAAARSRAGVRAHERQLSGERRRATHAGWYWALVVVGVLVLVGAVVGWGH